LKLGFVAATVSGAPLTTLKYEGGGGAEKCSFRRDFFAFPSENSHVVAERQIDAWSDPQDGSRTFDGFWMEQAATQTTRKVARASYRNEIGAAQAIQGLPKGCLSACFGTQGMRMIGDVG
jgi:hypothetical protein